jgi:glucose-6-phosphate isomerase
VTDAANAAIASWAKAKNTERLWARDAKLWTNGDEAKWLGWLEAPATAKQSLSELQAFAADVKKGGFTHVLLLGMGGSSLCPDVLRHTFGSIAPNPKLEVLDSTDPAQVAAVEKKVDLGKTLVIVASKSGSTLEPNIMEQYFFERMTKILGANAAGKNFVAITDPGSKLEAVAKAKNYRRIFAGVPSIGGRFSALSNFGLVPAASIGIDLQRFVARAAEMSDLCGAQSRAEANPGRATRCLDGCLREARPRQAHLRRVAAAREPGRLARATRGRIDRQERQGHRARRPRAAGAAKSATAATARSCTCASNPRRTRRRTPASNALEQAGHAVARIRVADKLDLGAEFFRWEIATAVAGLDPRAASFDQPDVEASKVVTKELTSAYELLGALPAEKRFSRNVRCVSSPTRSTRRSCSSRPARRPSSPTSCARTSTR